MPMGSTLENKIRYIYIFLNTAKMSTDRILYKKIYQDKLVIKLKIAIA